MNFDAKYYTGKFHKTHNRTFTVIQHFSVHNFIRYKNIFRTLTVTMPFASSTLYLNL